MIGYDSPIELGPKLFARNAKGALETRIGTVFLRTPGLVTLRGIHATQRLAFIDELNRRRTKGGEPPLTQAEIDAEIAESVDLLFDEHYALIRPDPQNMALALRGDEFLQHYVSKRQIRYLNIQNRLVRDALRMRGEAWRMAPVPRLEEDIRKLIDNARVGIGGRAIYYYNHLTGTRFLTLDSFRSLAELPTEELRGLLIEIQKNLQGKNRFANPEIDFLPKGVITPELFAKESFESMDEAALREAHARLCAAFEAAIQESCLRHDDPNDSGWRKALSSALVEGPNETGVSAVIQGLSPEFFMQIEWLPGGSVEESELFFDSIFMEADANPEDAQLQRLCDRRARAILFNYVREYSQIQYVNIGRTLRSLSNRIGQGPRAFVYIVEMKELHRASPQIKIIRIQRWTTASHLADGDPLLSAMIKAEDYTDYVMDRRLGARQLGMHLPPTMTQHAFRETVHDHDGNLQNVWTGYFERDYISGIATSKIPNDLFTSDAFCNKFFTLLGQAAAPNLIVGRATIDNNKTIFDDGDEVITLDAFNLPDRLILSEPTGAFANYNRPYGDTIADYAKSLNKRKAIIPNFENAVNVFVRSFEDEFTRIQRMYRERRVGFDTLFRDRPRDPNGSIAYRWECVLARLDKVNTHALAYHLHDRIDL